MIRKLSILIIIISFFACKETETIAESHTMALLQKSKQLQVRGDKIALRLIKKKDSLESLSGIDKNEDDQADEINFINIEKVSKDFVLDMRYATPNNFLKEKVYSCAKCYVRDDVAEALIAANEDFMKKGYKIKFFDCYRPHSVQKKMWKIFPKPGYVANPAKGSIHNKGAAVDITLVTLEGAEVDMGTDFDFFGKKAHHAYQNLPEKVLANRKILRETMKKHGFRIIRSEWWHYNYKSSPKYKVSDFTWQCDN